ncbi:MAG: MotA/TolQ/ExbB proton channel family protein [Alphaproteobacteria bacterium]|nr:MotA/TolQ/ExbB proton channel family protein [Alphaproteobacteria bacterium]MBN2674958.1 MotA/TolQ/ExbB proton channel family protein [Alphaproteobacteria bacterium]
MTNNFSLLSLFTSGNIMTLLISLSLVMGSVYSWAIIIEKSRMWRFERRNPTKIKSGDNLELVVDRLILPFDKNLWFLSMLSYVAPFVGLFGTIWGVMDSFASIGVNQSVSIGVIAPGLATALGTTALGLIAAVPAAIAYQYFTKQSDELYNRLDDSVKDIKSNSKKDK